MLSLPGSARTARAWQVSRWVEGTQEVYAPIPLMTGPLPERMSREKRPCHREHLLPFGGSLQQHIAAQPPGDWSMLLRQVVHGTGAVDASEYANSEMPDT